MPPLSLIDCTYASVPRPTRPIDDAGPLNGKTPPILISVAVTPGASAAKAGADSAIISADASLNFPNMTSSCVETRVCSLSCLYGTEPGCRGPCDRPSSPANYSSFLELVKRFQQSPAAAPASGLALRFGRRTLAAAISRG